MHTVLPATACAVVQLLEPVEAVGPESEGALTQTEAICTLPKPVLALGWQFEIHLDVLVTED